MQDELQNSGIFWWLSCLSPTVTMPLNHCVGNELVIFCHSWVAQKCSSNQWNGVFELLGNMSCLCMFPLHMMNFIEVLHLPQEWSNHLRERNMADLVTAYHLIHKDFIQAFRLQMQCEAFTESGSSVWHRKNRNKLLQQDFSRHLSRTFLWQNRDRGYTCRLRVTVTVLMK